MIGRFPSLPAAAIRQYSRTLRDRRTIFGLITRSEKGKKNNNLRLVWDRALAARNSLERAHLSDRISAENVRGAILFSR